MTRPLVRQHGEHPRWKWARWCGTEIAGLLQHRSDEVHYQLLSVYGREAGVVDPEVVAPTPDEELEQAFAELEECGIRVQHR